MDSSIGFSVYADGDYQYPYQVEIVRFPLVFTRVGGHYNPSGSVFIYSNDIQFVY